MSMFDAKLNAFTLTGVAFTQPAVSASVSVPVDSSKWMPIGLLVFCALGGAYSVTATPDDETVTLVNLGSTGNAAPGTVIPARSLMSPGGATPAAVIPPPKIVLHDLTYAPVALWQMNDTLVDSSGNGFTLFHNGGVPFGYADIYSGVRGIYQLGGTPFRTVTQPGPVGLELTGDMTIECFLSLPLRSAAVNHVFLGFDQAGSGSTFNRLYGVSWDSTAGYPVWTSQSGSQVTATYTENTDIYPSTLCHFAVTRASNIIQFYCNGLPLGAASTALTAPTGGTAGNFQLGQQGSSGCECQIASLKIIASALTAAQVKGEYNRTLGPVLGLQA